MSQPRAPRTARPKAGAKNQAAVEQPAAEVKAEPIVEQPVAVVAEVKTEPVVELPIVPKEPKAKKLVVAAGNSSARTRRHIDRLGINLAIETEIAKHKSQLDALKQAEALLVSKKVTEAVTVEVEGKNKTEQRTRDATAEELAAATESVRVLSLAKADHEMHTTALSRERTRFSNESAAALSFVCEEIVDSLVEHTMDAAIVDGKVTIQVAHLHSAGVEALPLFPLFSTLPKYAATAAKLGKIAEDAAKAALIESAASAMEKKLREQYASFLPKEGKVAKAKPVKPIEAGDAAEDAADNKVSFKFYVVHACDRLKASEKYTGKNIKISNDIKTYLSDLVIEFIGRIANLVVLTVKSMKNTTVTDVAIMRTIEALLIDGHKAVDTVTFKEEQIKDPAFIKAEAEKRKLDPAYKVAEIPLITGLVATKTTVYPTSYYDTLAAIVAEKLVEYKKKPPVLDAEDAAETGDDAAVAI